MKFKEAKQIAAMNGYNLKLIEETGEYRAAPNVGSPKKQEAQAYYTDDLEDAVGTIRAEANRRDMRKTQVFAGDVQSHGEFHVAL